MSTARMSYLRPSLVMLLLLTLLTGVAYPLLTTSLSSLLFSQQAQGSLQLNGDKIVGSSLIGQSFTQADYFWGRPSVTAETPYNPLASGGSNLAASNPALDQAIAQRVAALRAANSQSTPQIPVDLVTASGSGLDPHISVDAAQWQAPRIANVRGLSLAQVDKLIDDNTDTPFISYLGQPVVNVLKLNLALDNLTSH